VVKPQSSLLVIGGTGFIGRYVVAEAIRRDFDVTALSLNNPNPKLMIDEAHYVSGDVTRPKDLTNSLKKNDFHYVVNLGGYIDHSDFRNGGRKVIDDHFKSVLNLLEFLDWNCLESFLQVGSSSEYGNILAPQHEDDNAKPFSPYSLAKFLSSQTLQMLNEADDFPAILVRIFLTYGPGQSDDRFIPQIIKGCLNDESFETSAGTNFCDFTYVEDIASGLLDLLVCKEAVGEIVNLASGEPIEIRSIVNDINNIIGKGRPIYGSLDRPIHNPELYADITKAKRLINWKPDISLEEGLKLTINSIKG